jgi:hypothetical protein
MPYIRTATSTYITSSYSITYRKQTSRSKYRINKGIISAVFITTALFLVSSSTYGS